MTTFAAVDVGSNTVRLLVGVPSDAGHFEVVDRTQVITRIGEGMGNSRILRRTAIERTVGVLSEFKRRWEWHGADRYRAVATSAVREAQNRDDFVAAARFEDIRIEVISGIEEARLVMDGISSAVRTRDGAFVIIDVGGGSTEFISVKDGEVKDIVSTDLGVVRLTELFLAGDPPDEEELTLLTNFVEKEIDVVYNRFTIAETPPHPRRLIGTAGTVTTLAAVDRGLAVYDPDLVEGYPLRYGSIARILREFSGVTSRGRLDAYPILTRGREDVIVAGTAIVKGAMERFGADVLLVSDRGLLEGIIEGLIGSPRRAYSTLEGGQDDRAMGAKGHDT